MGLALAHFLNHWPVKKLMLCLFHCHLVYIPDHQQPLLPREQQQQQQTFHTSMISMNSTTKSTTTAATSGINGMPNTMTSTSTPHSTLVPPSMPPVSQSTPLQVETPSQKHFPPGPERPILPLSPSRPSMHTSMMNNSQNNSYPHGVVPGGPQLPMTPHHQPYPHSQQPPAQQHLHHNVPPSAASYRSPHLSGN